MAGAVKEARWKTRGWRQEGVGVGVGEGGGVSDGHSF